MQPLISGKHSILNEFDIQNPDNIGKPFYFDLELYIAAIEMMICSDELESAIWMIDHPPAWYRDNMPKELTDIKNRLYRQCYDVFQYAQDPEETECEKEFGEAQFDNGYMHPRAEIISEILTKLNAENIFPWICDLGCSHGNLPLGLMRRGFKFAYKGMAVNREIEKKVRYWTDKHWFDRPFDDKQFTILWNTEVLEHAWREEDIVQASYKFGIDWNMIILSVPYGCLYGGLPDWKMRPLGHVRGYSHKEFYEFANKNWPGYKWKLHIAPSMVLVGEK